jgi:hypothetical protein
MLRYTHSSHWQWSLTPCAGAHNGRNDGPGLELKDYIHGNILASEQASFDFLAVCTDCHLDHIGGIEAFAMSGASVFASGKDHGFLSLENER